jgi:hypothetical protein
MKLSRASAHFVETNNEIGAIASGCYPTSIVFVGAMGHRCRCRFRLTEFSVSRLESRDAHSVVELQVPRFIEKASDVAPPFLRRQQVVSLGDDDLC